MADSPQPTTSPPPLQEPIVGFIGEEPYSVDTLGRTLRVHLGSAEENSNPLTSLADPVLTFPKEAAQLLLLMSTIQRFIDHLYPNGV